jgi:hypothetical protein
MVDARKYFGVSFVTLDEVDLAGGTIPGKVISATEEGRYGKLDLHFSDNTALSLNATNSRTLVKALGPETEDWIDHAIDLSVGEVEYQGKPQRTIALCIDALEDVEREANAKARLVAANQAANIKTDLGA